jgi:hypothetical protein
MVHSKVGCEKLKWYESSALGLCVTRGYTVSAVDSCGSVFRGFPRGCLDSLLLQQILCPTLL